MQRPLSITFILAIMSFMAVAQKLPIVQRESVRASEKMTIDGKFREWGGRLQAYNSATEISYTLANDDSNLYLVVQVINEDVINKILRGGLTFSVPKDGKKNDKNTVAITYPVSDIAFYFHLNVLKNGKPDTAAAVTASIIEKNNKLLEQHIKSIGVNGIEGVDSTISIYNEFGIKAACLFDHNRTYTLELCLPLKFLNLSINNEAKFAYHVVLNGYKRPITVGAPVRLDGTPVTSPKVDAMMAFIAQRDAALSAKTDFWGEYTLAKK